MDAASSSNPAAPRSLPPRARVWDGLWHGIGRQLAHPSGPFGRLVGLLMGQVNRRPYDLALEALRPRRTDMVLEIGFGPGEGLAELARQVTRGRIFGLDGSLEMVRSAARSNRAAVANGHLTLATGDFRRLPWDDGIFDAVLAVNAAYFFDAEGQAMGEVARVLRPGGRVVLYVTDRETMRHWPFAGADTHTTYDATDLRNLLLRGGFAPDRVEVREVLLPMKVKGLIAIAERAGA